MLDIVGEIRKLRFEYGRRFEEQADITCETKNGLMTFSNKDRCIGRRLYSRRHWSWQMLQSCQQLLIDEQLIKPSNNDVLINVGANIGCILVPLVREKLFQRGIGFEPAPENARYLRTNIEQNGLADRAQAFQLGLSNEDRVASFEMSPRNTGDNRVRVSQSAEDRKASYSESTREVIQIQLTRLDDVIQEHQVDIGPHSLLWVDIQGHEGLFLEGARDTLSHGVPMVTELWPYGINRSGMSPLDFCSLVRDLFATYYIQQRSTWKQYSTDQFRQTYSRYDRGTSGTDIVLIPR